MRNTDNKTEIRAYLLAAAVAITVGCVLVGALVWVGS